MRACAPAKLNLCLLLGPPRHDGRHQLVTMYESLSLVDDVELTLSPGPGPEPDRVICPEVPGENLARLTLAGLRDRGWDAPGVVVEITKRIPIAAGMAGGSADAAAVLRIALALSPGLEAVVGELAAELGSDVPAQLAPGPSIGTGAGDVVTLLAPLGEHAVVVVPSRERLPTTAVYAEADRLGLPRPAAELAGLERSLREAALAGGPLPGELAVNDLQPAAVSLCPSISAALRDVVRAGAERALVSGSGPTVVGLLWGEGARARADEAARALAPRHPGTLVATPVEPGFGAPEPVLDRVRPRG